MNPSRKIAELLAAAVILAACGAWLVRRGKLPPGQTGFVELASARQTGATIGWLLLFVAALLALIIAPGLYFGFH